MDNGDIVTALAFVMDPCRPFRDGYPVTTYRLPSGPLSTNAQYLFTLEQELNNYGMQNYYMVELVKQVHQLS